MTVDDVLYILRRYVEETNRAGENEVSMAIFSVMRDIRERARKSGHSDWDDPVRSRLFELENAGRNDDARNLLDHLIALRDGHEKKLRDRIEADNPVAWPVANWASFSKRA